MLTIASIEASYQNQINITILNMTNKNDRMMKLFKVFIGLKVQSCEIIMRAVVKRES